MTQIKKADALAHALQAERGNFKSIAALLSGLLLGKLNSKLDLEAGRGILSGVGTVYRSSVQKVGGIIKTEILIDLTGLASSTTDLDIIGVGTNPAHLGQILQEKNGLILGGQMKCLEVPAGGADDIDLYMATEGTGVFDGGIGALTETALITKGSAWTLNQEIGIADPAALVGKYLYLCGGEAGTAATYTAGKFLITLYGYDVNE
jgi:hypothetical protein